MAADNDHDDDYDDDDAGHDDCCDDDSNVNYCFNYDDDDDDDDDDHSLCLGLPYVRLRPLNGVLRAAARLIGGVPKFGPIGKFMHAGYPSLASSLPAYPL